MGSTLRSYPDTWTKTHMLSSLLLSVACMQATSVAPVPEVGSQALRPRNIVLVLADDLGVDMVGAYDEGGAPPCTPHIDGLASQGLLFRNAWANPSCTPTRAAMLTGRHGFRTGLGQPGAGAFLELTETTIPEAIRGYTSSCVGKWHLAQGPGSASHPNDSGFHYYAGGTGGGVSDYFNWTKTTNGVAAQTTVYATTDTVDEAIAAMVGMPEPWFLFVSLNAPHTPYHEPPASVCQASDCALPLCGNLPANPSNRDLGEAMIEAMDAELGCMLTVLDAVDPRAYVIFMGDNGTARQIVEPPFISQRAKGSVYEGGINVPLIVRGPGVARGECAALVSCVDMFATITELGGRVSTAEDSVSMVPYFRNPEAAEREFVYAETFSPNGGTLPFTEHRRAVRNVRYKLLRQTGQADELYDLDLDPFEVSNLLLAPDATALAAYGQLESELVRLGVN